MPVNVLGLGDAQADEDEDDQQKHRSAAHASRWITVLLVAVVLEQADDSPNDQEHRPPVREPVTQYGAVDQVRRTQQEQHANQNQDQRSCQRATQRRTDDRRTWSRASHWTPAPGSNQSYHLALPEEPAAAPDIPGTDTAGDLPSMRCSATP